MQLFGDMPCLHTRLILTIMMRTSEACYTHRTIQIIVKIVGIGKIL